MGFIHGGTPKPQRASAAMPAVLLLPAALALTGPARTLPGLHVQDLPRFPSPAAQVVRFETTNAEVSAESGGRTSARALAAWGRITGVRIGVGYPGPAAARRAHDPRLAFSSEVERYRDPRAASRAIARGLAEERAAAGSVNGGVRIAWVRVRPTRVRAARDGFEILARYHAPLLTVAHETVVFRSGCVVGSVTGKVFGPRPPTRELRLLAMKLSLRLAPALGRICQATLGSMPEDPA